MAPEPSFTEFNDSLIDAVAADWYLAPPYSTSEFDTFFSEIPPDAPSAPGATQDVLHPNRSPHEASTFQSSAIATSPHNTRSTASRDEMTEAEARFTGLAQSSNGVLPTLLLQAPPSPPVTIFPPNWSRVPQRDYGRKRWNFKLLEPISFSVNGHPGINMGAALRKTYAGLDGRDDPVLQGASGAISCRLLFPGYPANTSSHQIHVLDWTRNRLPITRSKLAHEVAKKLERYLNLMANFTPDETVEGRWRIGEGFMHIGNMFLVRLESVSKGSFQPEIWVADPSMVHAGWE